MQPGCSFPHQNTFIHPTDHFFHMLYIHSIIDSSQVVHTLRWFHGRPYIILHSNLFPSLTTSINFMVSLRHLRFSSPLKECCLINCFHQGKLPLGSYMSILISSTLWLIVSSILQFIRSCFCALDPFVTSANWVVILIIPPLSQEITSPHSNICFYLQTHCIHN